MGIVYFGTRSSADFGLVVEKCPDYQIAPRRVEKISVEGRNGELLRDTGTYSNVTQVYSVYYNAKETSFQEEAHKISAWLGAYGGKGYQFLADDYDGDTFRLATFTGMTNFRNWMNDFGRIDLTFDCMPQRWLNEGQGEVDISGGTIPNDFMACYPLLEIIGNGTVEYGGATITITDNTGISTFIDTETGDAFSGTPGINFNQAINFAKGGRMATGVTGSWQVPVPSAGLLDAHLYFNWWSAYGSPNSGILAINMIGSHSYELTGTGWTVSHNFGDEFVTFSCDSADIIPAPPLWCSMKLTGSLTSLLNRNGVVTIDGSLDPVPNGGLAISASGPTVNVTPRWWTL